MWLPSKSKSVVRSKSQLRLNLKPPFQGGPSMPGFLRLPEKTAPTSQVLDVRFYTAPHSPPDFEGKPQVFYDPTASSKLGTDTQDAQVDSYMNELIDGYQNRNKWKMGLADRMQRRKAQGANDSKTYVNLNALIKLCGPSLPGCPEKDFISEVDLLDDSFSLENLFASQAQTRDFDWAKLFDRPTITVKQSAFITLLEKEVESELQRCACAPPAYEISRLKEDLNDEHLSLEDFLEPELDLDEYISVKDAMSEPEEKLMARLRIYKRALNSIILHFKNLRPLLKVIKINYDGIVGLRNKQVSDIKVLKNNYGYTLRCFDKRLAQIRNDGYRKLCEAEKRCFLLIRHVDKQDSAIRTMTEILNNLEGSLEEEKVLKITSEDKRKKLVLEINDLRRQVIENSRILGQEAAEQAAAAAAAAEESEKTNEDDVSTVTDASAIRNVLENTRTKLSETQKRITILEADYSDVIPKKDYESLKLVMDGADKEFKVDQDDFDTISSQVQDLKDQVDALIEARDDLQELVSDLQLKATPRPSWSKIAEYVEGGLPRWQEIYEGKSSKQIVDQVVEVLTGKKVKGAPEWIQPLGTGDGVPPYLRHDSPVRQRNFTRREAAVIIQDIQQSRIDLLETVKKLRDEQEDDYGMAADSIPAVHPFQEFCMKFFEERLPWPNLRMEYVYNLVDACRRFQILDSTLGKFLGILENQMDEALIHTLRSDIAKIRDVLMTKSVDGGHPMGVLPASEFAVAMREAFPQKFEDDIKLLEKAAAKQTGAVADWFMMKYSSFFAMTDEGLVGDFITEVVRQFDKERTEYIYDILHYLLSELGVSLQSAERENDPAGETDVTMEQIFNAITSVDPQIPDDRVARALIWIFMAESTLPGMPVKGLVLVRYIQEQLRKNKDETADSDEEDDGDLAEFERAIDEIRKGADSMLDDENEPEMNEKKKKAMLNKLKVLPLKVILQRLKGGCLFRYTDRNRSTFMASEGMKASVGSTEGAAGARRGSKNAPKSGGKRPS